MNYRTLLLFFSFFCSFTVKQKKESVTEYNLKAAFIFNFTRYIEWDASQVGNEFVIGVFGVSPINEPLLEIVKTETVYEKKISIRQFSKPSEIGFCNILFISQKAASSLDDILAKVAGKGTLIISEKEGYAALGAAINFVIVNSKLKFEANVKAINAAGLKVSSQLLKLAIIKN